MGINQAHMEYTKRCNKVYLVFSVFEGVELLLRYFSILGKLGFAVFFMVHYRLFA